MIGMTVVSILLILIFTCNISVINGLRLKIFSRSTQPSEQRTGNIEKFPSPGFFWVTTPPYAAYLLNRSTAFIEGHLKKGCLLQSLSTYLNHCHCQEFEKYQPRPLLSHKVFPYSTDTVSLHRLRVEKRIFFVNPDFFGIQIWWKNM